MDRDMRRVYSSGRRIDAILERYPRLIRAMCRAACLSTYEAACALADRKDGSIRGAEGGEAVWHYGGLDAVLQNAWRLRHCWGA